MSFVGVLLARRGVEEEGRERRRGCLRMEPITPRMLLVVFEGGAIARLQNHDVGETLNGTVVYSSVLPQPEISRSYLYLQYDLPIDL